MRAWVIEKDQQYWNGAFLDWRGLRECEVYPSKKEAQIDVDFYLNAPSKAKVVPVEIRKLKDKGG